MVHGRDERAFPMSTLKKLHRYRREDMQTGTLHALGKEMKVASPEVLARSEKLGGRTIGNHLGAKARPMVKMKSENFMSSDPSFLFLNL